MAEQCTSLKRTNPAAYDIRRRFEIKTCNPRKIVARALPHYGYGTSRYVKAAGNSAIAKCMTQKNRLLARIKRLVKTADPKARCVKNAIRTFVALSNDGFKPQMVLTKNAPDEEFMLAKNHVAKFHMFVRVENPEKRGEHIYISLEEGGVIDKPKAKLDIVSARKAIAIAEMATALSYDDNYDGVRELQLERRSTSRGTIWDRIVGFALELCAGLFSIAAEHHYDAAVRYDPPKSFPFAAIYFNYARFSFVVKRDARKAWALNEKALRKDPTFKDSQILKEEIQAYKK